MRLRGITLQLVFLLLFPTGVFAQSLSDEAMANFKSQLAVVQAKKHVRTAVQKKISADLDDYVHEEVLKDRPVSLPKAKHHVTLSPAEEVLVDIKANVSNSLIAAIKKNGGTIINAFPQYKAIRASIPITAMETIAGRKDVIFIDKAIKSHTNQLTVSEGYRAHNVPVLRTKGYNGQGIRVGVLSDSIQSSPSNPLDYLTADQGSGDLPPAVAWLRGQAGAGEGEGVAMLEIVYDLAPAASLYFATADGGPANFANNIIGLMNAGCKVIIDDVNYGNESPFQDDVISQAVTTVTNAGVAYFSCAINNGNLHSGNSGTWEGDFADSGHPYGGGSLHAFSGGETANEIQSDTGSVDLFWSDPLGGSANEYDLYVCDTDGNIVAYSNNTMNGTQDPYQSISGVNFRGDYVLIVKDSQAAPRFLHLEIYRSHLAYSTNGATRGHATVEAAFGVAATTALGFTTPFTGTEPVEVYSSDGPRRVFYNPNGTAITPGNLSSTGGKLRYKPDIMAADCVATSANYPIFDPFCGTSAAAPHAGAIAACLFSASPNLTPAALRTALTQSALPYPPSWTDYSGYGIVMADRALSNLPSAATHFAVSAPSPATAGIPFNFTVTALDDKNRTVTDYPGTVRFTSTDSEAVLPTISSLTKGKGTFSATLAAPPKQTITATDAVYGSITGTSKAVKVVTLSISGTVRTTTGSPARGVLMTLSNGATATTGTYGSYTFPNLASGTYTVAPSEPGYNPPYKQVILKKSNVAGVNFKSQ